jgi:asparagine synthase (glutamine-hydrolysing)
MCGIAGIIGSRASLETVNAMTSLLRHRGPDGEGSWSAPGVVLGHRRLSIIDLSHASDQPMVLGSHVLTYNGEIYNHTALRAKLPGPWHSTGDTEVLLHLLAREGTAALSKIVGMFAFAVWDGQARRLTLARDRLGIKPLYYRHLPDGLAFASELKALLVLDDPKIDASAVQDYLFHGYVPAPKSIYQGIAKLPAGHTLTWQDGRVHIERYWEPSIAIKARSADETLAELDALLREVIPAHTLADVPVGVFLSGGIDSALTAWYLEAPHTYSLGFDAKERSELAGARAAAAHLGTVHTEMTAQAADFEQALDAIPRIFDEPFADSAAWSNYLIAQFARREVTVALSGEGGDEVFCGYPRYWSRVGARSSVLNRALARWLPPLSRTAASMQRHAYTGLPAFAAALGGMPRAQIE